MASVAYQLGDLVYAAEDTRNDGGMPDVSEPEGLIAALGSRGVIVGSGVAEMDNSRELYLVCFENGADAILGKPVGCLPEELTQDQPLAA